MRFPATDDAGDYLIYHRMTGLRVAAGHGSAADVAALRRDGCVLEPYSDRWEDGDEYGPEMFGINDIDIAAGDGDAVFCSPFAPVNPTLWGLPHIKRSPGVAFRLSDVTDLRDVSVRPIDFQNFYLEFATAPGSPIAGAYERMGHADYVDPSFMDPLSPAFEIFRLAETYATFDALDWIYRHGAAPGFGGYSTPGDEAFNSAAHSALEFIDMWDEPLDDLDEPSMAMLHGAIERAIRQGYADAMDSWQRVTPASAEVLVWGALPLSLAVLAFDNEDIIELEPLEAIGELAGVPAAKLGNG